MQVRLNQVTIGKVERRGSDDAAHHLLRLAKIVLVVRALRGAVGHNQSSLTRASRASGTLRVICRSGRHVSHVDRIERGDVDAELHRRRAK
jgi:hypothetical protein